MNAQTAFEFQWLSPLGISVSLFLAQGVLTVFVALLVLVFNPRFSGVARADAGDGGLVLSGRMDSSFFGRDMRAVIRNDPVMAQADLYTMYVRAGLWLAIGIFQISLVWFGMRDRQVWAFWTVVAANAAALVGWLLVAWAYVKKGVSFGLDLPPVVFLLPVFLVPVASMLGWIGLR